MTEPIRFGIVAGEKSGDILGAGLMTALREIYPDAQFIGVGGPAMLEAGCQSLVPMDRLSVMGFVEPLGRLPELLRIKRRLERTFLERPPAAFIGIDSPDFNLRIEKNLRRRGIRTVHYVSPSVWAYRERRIVTIKAAVDLMLTLFPFETGIYQRHGVAVSCVGHPLADQIGFDDQKQVSRQALGIATDDQVVAVLPGSRSGEIQRLGPVFLGSALAVLRSLPQLRFLIPASGSEAREHITALLQQAGLAEHDQFLLVDDSHAAMAASDLVLMASGTATLEAMLLRRPMIVCYKLAPLSYALASRLLKVPFFSLPNLLAGRQLVPELRQHQVTVEAISAQVQQQLASADVSGTLLPEFERLHRMLRRDASASAARAIAGLLAAG